MVLIAPQDSFEYVKSQMEAVNNLQRELISKRRHYKRWKYTLISTLCFLIFILISSVGALIEFQGRNINNPADFFNLLWLIYFSLLIFAVIYTVASMTLHSRYLLLVERSIAGNSEAIDAARSAVQDGGRQQ